MALLASTPRLVKANPPPDRGHAALSGAEKTATPPTPDPAPQPEAPAATVRDADPVGELPGLQQTFQDTVPFLNRSFPLPPGEWTSIIRAADPAKPPSPAFSRLVLLRHDGPVLTGLLFLYGNRKDQPSPVGFKIVPTCDRSDVTLSTVRAAQLMGRQDCLTVAWDRTRPWATMTNTLVGQIATTLDAEGVTPPPVLVTADVVVADTQYVLQAIAYFNPDRAGVPPDLATLRSQSGWAAINVGRDPAKLAYAERVRAWAETYRTALLQLLNEKAAPETPVSIPAEP